MARSAHKAIHRAAKRRPSTLAKVGALLAAPLPDVELLIGAMANPQSGIKFVLGIARKAGQRVSEVQSVIFDKLKWTADAAKGWLRDHGFTGTAKDEGATFWRFRQQSPGKYKEFRTIVPGLQNPTRIGQSDAYRAGRSAMRYAAAQHGTVNLTPSIAQREEWGHSWSEFMRGWNEEKRAKVNPTPSESISSYQEHLGTTTDPEFRSATPGEQAATMTAQDLCENPQPMTLARWQELQRSAQTVGADKLKHLDLVELWGPQGAYGVTVESVASDSIRYEGWPYPDLWSGRPSYHTKPKTFFFGGLLWRGDRPYKIVPTAEASASNPYDPDDPLSAFDYGVEGGHLALSYWHASVSKPINPEVVYAFHHQLHVKRSEYPEYLRGFLSVVPSNAVRKSNPGDLGQAAFDAAKDFRLSGAYSETGVANARVAKYGFTKWWDAHFFTKEDLKGYRKSTLLKNWMEGWAAGKRVEKRGNPESAAADLYEQFHGKPPGETLEIHTDKLEHEWLTQLGVLVELKVATLTNLEATIRFDKNAPQLCSSEDGRQLYIEGGDQSIDLRALKMDGAKWRKDSMALGVLVECTYQTEKGFQNFQLTDYYHHLGEETGVQPFLLYDPNNELLSVSGGQYEVKPEGIVN